MNPLRCVSRSFWQLVLAVAFLATLGGPIARAEDAPERGGGPPHGKGKAGAHVSRHAAWKSQHAAGGLNPQIIDATGPPYVGRASMVINSAGTVAYTKVFLGLEASCDTDLRNTAEWQPNQAHTLHETVVPLGTSGGNKFMAQNAGTTGAVEPAWPAAFGGTVVDGTITWVNIQQNWVSGRAYTVGMVAEPASISVYRIGFNFLATTAGTSGVTEPVWPTTAGATVNDNGIIWQAIGFYPGSFTGCSPMQMVSRASGGAETTIASEGDLIPGGNGEQLMGWSDFWDMNASGKVAFRAESAGFIRNDDESSSAIFTAGPGAGALTKLIGNGATVGGRNMCGFSAMTAINAAGQVLSDGYGREHQATWTPNTAFGVFTTIYPTVANGFSFTNQVGGTSGAVEPTWPTSPGQTVTDGTITWTGQIQECDENDHSLVRFTTGPGNELLVGQGSSVGGSTVIGFGSDDNSQPVGNCNISCEYELIDGEMNASGHVPVVLNLQDGTQGVFNFSGPGTSTQVARSGVAGVGQIGPRVSINDSDQVVYRAVVGGVTRLLRFTPPATTVTIVSVGDVINGHTISSIGAFSDINNTGNVVYGALFNGDSASGFYFWDGTNSEITTGGFDPTTLASEMITVNNADQVGYITGTTSDPDETDGAAEGHEDGGAFLWTKAVGSTKFFQVGDVVLGNAVTNLYAQHPSFAHRQFSQAGCLATAYMIGTDDPEIDCQEGDPAADCNGAGGPKLFVSCGAVCPTITLAPPTLPGGSQGTPYSQQITATGGTVPYTFALTAGTLPAGITLSASGLLSGTPTVAGTFPITVTATDSAACTGSQAYSLVIGSPTQVTININPPTRQIVVGSAASLTVTINIAQGTDTIVTLTSSDPTIATVPATVTILAGQTSATFQVNGVAAGGPVTITATLPPSFNAQPATASVTVVTAVLTIPTLSGWMLALLAGALAAVGILLSRLR